MVTAGLLGGLGLGQYINPYDEYHRMMIQGQLAAQAPQIASDPEKKSNENLLLLLEDE